MFDLIEEDLANEKSTNASDVQFREEDHPVYTMPTTYRRDQRAKGSNRKILFIIFGTLFVVAIAATALFLFLSQPKQAVTPIQQTQSTAPTTQEDTAKATTEEASSETEAPPDQEQQPVPEASEGGEKKEQEGEQQGVTAVKPDTTAVPLLGIDADQDGLTDLEERLYSTKSDSADTDADSFVDGDEIKNLYDPLRGEQSRLDVSGLVNTYTNQTYQYSLLYPSSWVAQSTDRTDREVMISSASGEFFTITVQPNPNRLTPVDWYVSQAPPGADTSRLQSFSYDTWSGVMTDDSLHVYLTRSEGDPQKQTVMYQLKYNLNTKNELNFFTTLQMMLRSFIFTDLSFVK
ncbi:hypothetical protein HY623_04240 [Candidatus Uhrbacteria bacterium]|nr:hypothetical protein [Candidatus Uhrbacteria bacterium]